MLYLKLKSLVLFFIYLIKEIVVYLQSKSYLTLFVVINFFTSFVLVILILVKLLSISLAFTVFLSVYISCAFAPLYYFLIAKRSPLSYQYGVAHTTIKTSFGVNLGYSLVFYLLAVLITIKLEHILILPLFVFFSVMSIILYNHSLVPPNHVPSIDSNKFRCCCGGNIFHVSVDDEIISVICYSDVLETKHNISKVKTLI